MKRITTILLILAVFINNTFAANRTQGTLPVIKTLIINADVTVVLVDAPEDAVQIMGDHMLKNLISIDNMSDSLVINTSKNLNLKSSGIIYIPVKGIRKIQINSKAAISSLDVLNTPRIDILINGACELMLTHTGGIHITGTEDFDVEYTIEQRKKTRTISLK